MRFTVRQREPVLVAPTVPTPHEFKQFADVDFRGTTRPQNPGNWFYRGNRGMSAGAAWTRVIREALSRALAFYYPFIGLICRRPDERRAVVEYTSESVIFAEFDTDVRLEQFGDAL